MIILRLVLPKSSYMSALTIAEYLVYKVVFMFVEYLKLNVNVIFFVHFLNSVYILGQI